MSIRLAATTWLSSNHGLVQGKVYTSKYYRPEESWPKTRVWWFQIPLKWLDASATDSIHLVCQVSPGGNKFYYLKVPLKYFALHREKFHIVQEKISMYLSAEPGKLFVEERGHGQLNFNQFVIS